MPHSFDNFINRRDSDSAKWNIFGPDVLPMWVADMDFRVADPIVRALHERVEHGIFGYQMSSAELSNILVDRLETRHHLHAAPDNLVYLPNVVTGLNVAASIVGERGDGILMLAPLYPPFLSVVAAQGRVLNDVLLAQTRENGLMRYEIDFDALEAAVTPQTKLFLFCNPHNPVGRVYTRDELERVAEFCIRHDLILCSDEIHCDLVYAPNTHISIASLSPEIASRTITLLAPSKAFNLPSLGCAVAVITDKGLRKRFEMQAMLTGEHPYVMGVVGATAAYRDGQPWLDELLPYLQSNRDAMVEYVGQHLPDVATTCPEGTYLGWLDFRLLKLTGSPFQYFLDRAKVAFSDGAIFGKGGEGYIRVNFGCQRSTLLEALERVCGAIEAI